MVRDARAEKRGKPSGRPSARAERAQDRSHNFHPYAIRKDYPQLIVAIGAAMAAVLEDPSGFYSEMFDDFEYRDHGAHFSRVGANSYRDPAIVAALAGTKSETVLFTGGGIIPPAVFEVPGVRLIHVHTGFLPLVRG